MLLVVSTARLTVEASRDRGKFEGKYAARGPEFLLPNHVIAMAGDPENFKGLFMVRKDDGAPDRRWGLPAMAVSTAAIVASAGLVVTGAATLVHAKDVFMAASEGGAGGGGTKKIPSSDIKAPPEKRGNAPTRSDGNPIELHGLRRRPPRVRLQSHLHRRRRSG